MATTTLHVGIAQHALLLLHGGERTEPHERALYRAACELLRNVMVGEFEVTVFGAEVVTTSPSPDAPHATAGVEA